VTDARRLSTAPSTVRPTIAPAESPPATEQPQPYPAPSYAWYVVAVLMIVYVFSFIDRQILSLLVGPIRRDLGISDTQMSLLMGFSFALFYTFFGLPLGRLADSRSRRGLIAAGLFTWSLMTAGCGLARQYWHFLVLRLGVGVGEAALSPSAYSLIADYFPPKKLGTALSVYAIGVYIGSGLAFLLGGVVVGLVSEQGTWTLPIFGAIRPWQVVFLAVGLPGVLLTAAMATVREPIRRGVKKVTRDGRPAAVPVREVWGHVRRNGRTFFSHNLGYSLLAFAGYGGAAWIPTFLQRTHGVSARDAGIWFGTIVMIGGTLGIVFGGRMADWMLARGQRDAMMRIGIYSTLLWAPFGIGYLLVPSAFWSLVLLAPAVFVGAMTGGAAPAAITQITPNEMRAQASAFYLFVVNLIGIGLGPTAVAMVTDYVFGDDSAVRWSLLVVGLVTHAGCIASLALGLKPFRDSLDRVEAAARA
jgi:MFS family permease